MLLLPLAREEMGRIAAQTAKQILVQKVREAIREKVYDEYIDRKGEIINGTVKRFERGDMIVDLGAKLTWELLRQRGEESMLSRAPAVGLCAFRAAFLLTFQRWAQILA